jgi:LPS sulfotransferase NodH
VSSASESASDRATLTPGQRLYLPEYDLEPYRGPARGYLILAPQRTGSNYLCRRLCNVRGRFGMPSEYLNAVAIRMLVPRLLPGAAVETMPLAAYMEAVQRVRTSADGWFGLKLQPAQLAELVPGDRALFDFAASFQRIVVLYRRDKLGQAISGTLAQATGTWFNDGTTSTVDPARWPQLFPAIATNLARYIEEDRRLGALGKALARPWLRIEYEEILADGQAAFEKLVGFLGVDEVSVLEEAADVPVPAKPPVEASEALRASFLQYIGGGRDDDAARPDLQVTS